MVRTGSTHRPSGLAEKRTSKLVPGCPALLRLELELRRTHGLNLGGADLLGDVVKTYLMRE